VFVFLSSVVLVIQPVSRRQQSVVEHGKADYTCKLASSLTLSTCYESRQFIRNQIRAALKYAHKTRVDIEQKQHDFSSRRKRLKSLLKCRASIEHFSHKTNV
jgi:hypothetical protein